MKIAKDWCRSCEKRAVSVMWEITPFKLHYEKNDPFDVLLIKESKEKTNFVLEIIQKKAIFKKPIEEAGLVPLEKLTTVYVSNETKWDSYAQALSVGFDSALKDEPPKEFSSVLEETKKLNTLEEKVNHLVAYVTSSYNYLGDWRTRQGGISPRKLNEIIQTKYGDCKDFTTLLVSLLRALGLKADPAVVQRSHYIYSLIHASKLPSSSYFNHAIVRLEHEGHVYWIDPTNQSSYGLKYRPDIAGKKSLILTHPYKIENIPMLAIDDNHNYIEKIYDFSSPKDAAVSVKMKLKGDLALQFTGLQANYSKEQIQNILLNAVSEGDKTNGVAKFSLFDLSSRHYRELTFDIGYKQDSIGETFENKRLFKIPHSKISEAIWNVAGKQVGDLVLSVPQKVNRKYFFKGISLVGKRLKGCDIKSKWVDAYRNYSFTNEGLEVDEEVALKVPLVKNAELETTEFQVMQGHYIDCFAPQRFAYVFGKGKHVLEDGNLEKLFADLKAEERINKRCELVRIIADKDGRVLEPTNYGNDDALNLLKLNLKENPKHALSYRLMAKVVISSGYLREDKFSQEHLAQAKALFEKAFTLEPNNQEILLASVVQMREANKSKEEMQAAIDKALAMGYPKDFWVLNTLKRVYRAVDNKEEYLKISDYLLSVTKDNFQKSLIYTDMSNYSDNEDSEKQIEYFQKALEAYPKDAWTWMNLSHRLALLDRNAEAVEAGKKSLDVFPSGAGKHTLATAYNNLGDEYLGKQDYKAALESFEKAVELFPQSRSYFGLAISHDQISDHQSVFDAIIKGTSLDENPYQYITEKAELLKKKNPDLYTKLLLKAIEYTADPADQMRLYDNISYWYGRIGKHKEAVEIFNKMSEIGSRELEANPKNIYVLGKMAKLYVMFYKGTLDLDHLDQAEGYIKRAKVLDSKNEFIKTIATDVGSINSSLGRNNQSYVWKAKSMLHQFVLKKFNSKMVLESF